METVEIDTEFLIEQQMLVKFHIPITINKKFRGNNMHKFLHQNFFLASILTLLFASSILVAQITFTQPDETNLGITTDVGMQGFAWGDYDGDGDMDLFQSGLGDSSILYMNDVLGDSGKFINVSAQGVLVDSTGGYAEGAV